MNRNTPITNGGMVSMASFMPRYVEPHTTYSRIRPAQIARGLAVGRMADIGLLAGVMAQCSREMASCASALGQDAGRTRRAAAPAQAAASTATGRQILHGR